jgi:hypothetical protein
VVREQADKVPAAHFTLGFHAGRIVRAANVYLSEALSRSNASLPVGIEHMGGNDGLGVPCRKQQQASRLRVRKARLDLANEPCRLRSLMRSMRVNLSSKPMDDRRRIAPLCTGISNLRICKAERGISHHSGDTGKDKRARVCVCV